MTSVELLLEHGADRSMTDNKGHTPEDFLKLSVSEVKRALLRFHIDPDRCSQIDLESLCCDSGKKNDTPKKTVFRESVENRIALLKSLEDLESIYELYSVFEGGAKFSVQS